MHHGDAPSHPDDVMARYGHALAVSQAGDRVGARALLAVLWSEVGDDGDALHRCAIAHAMADVQDDVRDELSWDLRALQAAGELSDERLAEAGVSSPVAAFSPSLHLNLGDCYRRLGDPTRARAHLELGVAALDALPADGYGALVRSGLERLRARLQGANG